MNWNEITWLESQLLSLSCHCADHYQFIKPFLSLREVSCFCALWNQTLLQSYKVFCATKKYLYSICQKHLTVFEIWEPLCLLHSASKLTIILANVTLLTTKLYIQGWWEILIHPVTERRYLQIVSVNQSEGTDWSKRVLCRPYAPLGIREGGAGIAAFRIKQFFLLQGMISLSPSLSICPEMHGVTPTNRMKAVNCQELLSVLSQ